MNTCQPLDNHYSVAIVGYGPVGATLANLLGQAGIRTLLIDREASHYHLPRAVHFDDEVMRVFQTIGLAEAIEKTLRINPGMRFIDSAGNLMLDWPRPQELSQHGWHASYRFHQPDLEAILRSGVDRYGCVTTMAENEVVEILEEAGRVGLRCRHRGSKREITYNADYVVGCDGANSRVRNTLDPEMEDFGFNERWLVLDLLLKRDKPSLGDHSIQHCNPDRPATYVRGPKNRRRWEIRLHDDETPQLATRPEYVWQLLKAWLTPDEAELERCAVYTFNSRVVRTWRKDRLMVAGDAAHLTPPFMGQGMCAGIRDVSNLGWKLIAVVRGEARASLLDSYGPERHHNAAEYVKTAVRLGGLINTAGTKEALRAALKPADTSHSARMESIAPPLGPGIAAGNRTFTGHLFGQPRTLDGKRSDDLLGYRSVLYLDKSAFSTDAIRRAEDANFAVLQTNQSRDLADHLSRRQVKAILSRGDRYIVGSANDDEELVELCEWDKEFSVGSNQPE